MSADCLILASLGDMPMQLWNILWFVVTPVLALAGAGWLLQKRFGLDMTTLTRLNFYLVIPALVYYLVVDSKLEAAQAAEIVLFTVCMLASNAALTYLVALIRRVPNQYRSAMMMTVVFNNSGNYALPLQELAFAPRGLGGAAMGMQVFVMIVQNVATFTLGILLVASGSSRRRPWKENLRQIVQFPPLYALAAAIITVQLRSAMGPDAAAAVGNALAPLWQVVAHVKEAFIAVALVTLGAQLATVPAGGRSYPVTLSVILRLLVPPLTGVGLVYLLGLAGPDATETQRFLAQVLIVSTGSPTAVNAMLLCLQFDNQPDYAARAVFYSTILSPLTMTMVIYVATGGVLPGL
jgi:predicted permease